MLTPSDLAVLAFESQHANSGDMKQSRIRDAFGLSQARYYQRLNRIIDDPSALAAEPMLVKRLLRQKNARMSERLHHRLHHR